jgi:ribonuclease HI
LRGASGGTIVTDCLGVYRKCDAICNGHVLKERLLRGRNADLWLQVWEVLQANRCWNFEWVPSHTSEAEAAAAGIAQQTWQGNERADEAAKAQAASVDVPPQVLAAWAEQQAAHKAVWELIAESQVAHLAGRPRRQCGAAVKTTRGRHR